MKFTVQGTGYELPVVDDLTTVELREIKKHTGLAVRGIYDGLREMDADVMVAMAYVAKKRSGEDVTFDDFDDIKPLTDIVFPSASGEDVEEDPQDGSSPTGSGDGTPQSSES